MTKQLSAMIAVTSLLITSTAWGDILTATYDSWIREVDASDVNLRDNDLISVSSSTSTFGVRYGIVEFDLSSIGVPITSAHLQLWNQANGFSDDGAPADQTATLINGTWASSAGGGAAGVGLLTWPDINAQIALGTPLTQMGRIDIPPVGDATEYVNTSANAAELAALNADRLGDQLATFVLLPNEDGGDDRNSWGDDTTRRALLTINEAPFVYVPPVKPPGELKDAIWARADSSHINDGVLVSNNSSIIGGAPTVGLMEWDLSDFTQNPANLIGATLELFVADASRSQNPGQTAGVIDTTGGTPLANTANEPAYQAEYGGAELALEGFGVVPDSTGPLGANESIVTVATSADLQLIRDVMNGTDLLTLAFRGSDAAAPDGVTGQYWGDGDFGIAPVLTLTFVPEPGSTLLIGLALATLVVSGGRRR